MAESVDLFGNLGGTLQQTLKAVTDSGPVAWDSSTGAAVVLRHRDVDALAHDHRLTGIGLSFFDMMGITDGPLRDWYAGIMFTNEGTVHQRLRALVARAFTPRAVEGLRTTAAAMASESAGPARDGGDLMRQFGLLPTRVMCHLLGVPDRDAATFARWGDALSPIFLVMTADQIAAATQAIVELLAYVDDLARRRRDDPGPDLITALIAVEDAGDRLAHDELVGIVANMLVAGHDTTTSQIGCSLLVMLANPEEAMRVAADPALLPSLTSETIRLEPSIPIIPRTAAEAVPIDGQEIPAGSMVMLCSATANRDATTWKDPDRFDTGRFSGPGAPRVMSFGAGPHYCLGAALARVTLEECLRATLAVDGHLELAEAVADVPWRVLLGRSPERLLVTPARA